MYVRNTNFFFLKNVFFLDNWPIVPNVPCRECACGVKNKKGGYIHICHDALVVVQTRDNSLMHGRCGIAYFRVFQ